LRQARVTRGKPLAWRFLSVHPRISELIDYIDRQAVTLEAAYRAIPAERTARPAPDRWSPAESCTMWRSSNSV
jgi:hypothetical protein